MAARIQADIRAGTGNMKRSPLIFAAVYLTLLICFAVWILLDQFVIVREYEPVQVTASQEETGVAALQPPDAQPAPETEHADVISDPDSAALPGSPGNQAEADFSDSVESPSPAPENNVNDQVEGWISDSAAVIESIDRPEPEITLSQIRIYDTNVHIAEIRIPDASYLRTAIANDTYGRNIKQTVAEMAAEHDALIAINGDYFGFRYDGYVIRNGILYRDSVYDRNQVDLCFWPDGNMTPVWEADVTAQELVAQGVRDVLSFGPVLVQDGVVQISESLEIGTYSDDNPRTALGMFEPLHYLFVVSDGRTEQDKGLTPYQLAVLMRDMGAQLVYNLDGGGSSTMVYNGEVVNFPTAKGYREERRVSDIVYISR